MSSWQERLWPRDDRVGGLVHESDALLAIDKPAGIDCAWLRDRLAAALGDQLWLPQTLDSALSGVVLLAKTKAASRSLADQLERRATTTHVAIVQRGGSRRRVAITTRGRGQPPRKTLARELVGDAVPAHRVMLHLQSIHIEHPETSEPLTLTAPVPVALDRALDASVTLPATVKEIEERLRVAAVLRHPIAMGDTDAFRIANSGGDELPGVEVDRYGDFAVVGLRSAEAVEMREVICDAVHALGCTGVYLKIRQKHASVLVDTRQDTIAPSDPVRGDAAPSPLTIREEGTPLCAALGDGLSTGVFLDQREGRRWLRDRSPRTLLNLFAYHGAFTVAAIAGGTSATVTVDSSATALESARANLLQVTADLEPHSLVKADAFRWLAGAAKRERRFNVVVLDPPSFSTTKRSTFRADRDYHKLAGLALRCVAPGGALLACTNHRGITPRKFSRVLERAAAELDIPIHRMVPLPPPSDFPPEPGEPYHLKRVVVEVAS